MSPPPPPTLPPETMIGRYRIAKRIGVGGMGEVYEAQHMDLNKRVAVKILLPAIASRPEIIARFVREGQATAKLRHPHAVDISDVGVDHGVPFLVMEYLDGETLEALIAREAPLSPSRIAELMLPVLAAVKAAHEEDIVHRDLKPANIFLHRSRDNKLTPKVLDFGISKMADEDGASGLTQTASLLGTPHYMSPEQLRSSKHVDARSDQYALGGILYECATRQKAFRGETSYIIMNAIANGQFTPPRAIVPSLLPAFEAMVLRAMSTDPDARFESVHALGCALIAFADGRAKAFWESVFDDEPTTALPSWVQSALDAHGAPLAAPSADSLAGGHNSVAPTPAPGLRGSLPGTATPFASATPIPSTLVGSVVAVPPSVPKRSRAPAALVGGLVVLALAVGGVVVTRARGTQSAPTASSPEAPRALVAAPTPVATPVVPTTQGSVAPSAVPAAPAVPVAPAAPVAPVAPTAPTIAASNDAPAAPPEEHGHRRGHRRARPGVGNASVHSVSASGTNDIPILR